ncbi:uclacyanin-3-like [Hordeum vulgare subsp. vulgare]|uniref:Phytocyanin domain-containing protein n=1 Tax=Hordeum vulgare subsp. vulgare TaxID=112509 RepID=A0A8I6XCZ7_HORVV|nr:uclacyanin-3-like [Hordeum vulgare subsp. vulgare]KAI5002553.1 hypothetical protein ZWY2020_027203 [Hordeum vulgare]
MAAAAACLSIRLWALVVVLVFFSPTSSVASSRKRYKVGGREGWRVPPPQDKEMFYVKWSSAVNFFVGDSLEFVYKNDSVIKVSKAGYFHCNETVGIGSGTVPRDGNTLFPLDMPGFVYFASADLGHCKDGQKLIIHVLAGEPPEPATPSSSAQTPPAPSGLSSFSPAPGPAQSIGYSSAGGGPFVASLGHAIALAAALVLACSI